MTREDIIKTINTFLIEELEIDENLIQEDALLKEKLGIDSLDFVDIVVIVDREFGIRIKNEEMKEIKTLGQFYNFIDNKLNNQ
ncbi:MAG: acyl carrier protein [Bacteroidales bacterium]|jgi:acyl carrier protein|nr:acyl carrier protein [Bacteroidales bacterium]MBR4217513.1 acyl carrier protein [Bacteroidales bacterium]